MSKSEKSRYPGARERIAGRQAGNSFLGASHTGPKIIDWFIQKLLLARMMTRSSRSKSNEKSNSVDEIVSEPAAVVEGSIITSEN